MHIKPSFALEYKPDTSSIAKIIDSSLIVLVINYMPARFFFAPTSPAHIFSFNISLVWKVKGKGIVPGHSQGSDQRLRFPSIRDCTDILTGLLLRRAEKG